MAEPLKNIYSEEFILNFLKSWQKLNNDVDQIRFTQELFSGNWKQLELKERISKISQTLALFLPKEFEKAAVELKKLSKQLIVDGFKADNFEFTFIPEYLEKNGTNHFALSLEAMKEITQFTTCEFAIRPFIAKYPEQAMSILRNWSKHKHPSTRRLASEGCRPRLPWGMALQVFKTDPTPILTVLENLKNDSSLFVRKSVANNLNDISKDHPEYVLKILKKWKGKSKNTDWIVKHACRTLLKAGNPEAMTLFGYANKKDYHVDNFQLLNKKIKMGTGVEFAFKLRNNSKNNILIRLEYGIDFLKANGSQNRKVFKISERELKANEQILVSKKHLIKPISTRKYYAGKHGLSIIINGIEYSSDSFQLSL